MTECKFGKQKYSPKGEIGGEKKKKKRLFTSTTILI